MMGVAVVLLFLILLRPESMLAAISRITLCIFILVGFVLGARG